MAERQSDPRRLHKNAVPVLGLFLVLAGATPVIASQTLPSDCPELEDAGLQIPIVKLAAASAGEKQPVEPDSSALVTPSVNDPVTVPRLDTPADGLSKPGKYGNSTPLVETVPPDDTDSTAPREQQPTVKLPDIRTRFPGVSSVELKRFKRQMYRRDI